MFDIAAAAEVATRSLPRPEMAENVLSARMGNALCELSGWECVNGSGEKEIGHSQEENLSAGTLAVGNGVVRLVKLPFIEKIPPYTSWIFLAKYCFLFSIYFLVKLICCLSVRMQWQSVICSNPL